MAALISGVQAWLRRPQLAEAAGTPLGFRSSANVLSGGMPTDPVGPTVAKADVAPHGGDAQARELGGIQGRILSRDPLLAPPFRISWSRAGQPAAARSCGDTFELGPLAPGEWTLEVRSEPALSEAHDSAFAGTAAPAERILGARSVEVRAGPPTSVEIWIGREPVESAHLAGWIEEPSLDPSLRYSVHLRVSAAGSEPFVAKASVDGFFEFDFGLVPAGMGNVELRVHQDEGARSVEDFLAHETVVLTAGEEELLVLQAPRTVRVTFRAVDAGTLEALRDVWIHWGTVPEDFGGAFPWPRRTQLMVPEGRYVAIARKPGYLPGFATFTCAQGEHEVVLSLQEARDCKVRLLDSLGEPVPEAFLRVIAVDEAALGSSLMLSTQTDASGAFDASGLPDGFLTVEILARGKLRQLSLARTALRSELSVDLR